MKLAFVIVAALAAMSGAMAAPLTPPPGPEKFDLSRPEGPMFSQMAAGLSHLFGEDALAFAEAAMRNLTVVDLETPDGVTLRTRMYVPRSWSPGDAPLTTLYDRTPYGAAYTAISMIWALDGYAICMQDQRGTGGSTGNFEIWKKDYDDALTTIEWVVAQPWSNGKIVTWGISADAVSVYPLLTGVIPELKAMFPVLGVDNGYHLCYPQGTYRKGLIEDWLRSVCVSCIDDVKEHELYSEFWEPINMEDNYHNVHYPSVHLAGWHDIFVHGQILAFKGFLAGADPAVRAEQRLVVEPHGHCYQEVYTGGVRGVLLGLSLAREMFAEAHSGGIVHPDRPRLADEIDHVTFFVMGPTGRPAATGNWYTTLPDWPEYTMETFFLGVDANATTTAAAAPAAPATVSYATDPTDPVRHYGGHNLGGTCGPKPQNEIEARDDVVVFTSAPFAEDRAYVGAGQAVLFVSSDRNDTDFMVTITDVHPDGASHLVTQAAARMRFREGNDRTVFMVPGQIYEITIDLWETAQVWNAGHRLRVAVSSSSFERWGLNYHNGVPIDEMDDSEPLVATNTLHLGGATPSRVDMPAVAFDQIPPADFSAFGI